MVSHTVTILSSFELCLKDHIGFFVPWINLKYLVVIINPIRKAMIDIT